MLAASATAARDSSPPQRMDVLIAIPRERKGGDRKLPNDSPGEEMRSGNMAREREGGRDVIRKAVNDEHHAHLPFVEEGSFAAFGRRRRSGASARASARACRTFFVPSRHADLGTIQ